VNPNPNRKSRIRTIFTGPALIGSTIRQAIWWCAGAELSIARRIRGERVLLDCIGTSVLGTALLAFLTGAYAIHIIFEDRKIAIGFGLLWAMLIFNLDRFSVASIRRGDSIGNDLLVALPRLLLTFVIAIVIVVPLELRLFKPEIEQEIPAHIAKQLEAHAAEVERGNPSVEGGVVGKKVKDLESKLASTDARIAASRERQAAAQKSEDATEIRKLIESTYASIEERNRTIKVLEAEKSALIEDAAKEKHLGSNGKGPGTGPQWDVLDAKIKERDRRMLAETKEIDRIHTTITKLKGGLAALGRDPSLVSLGKERRLIEKELNEAIAQRRDAIETHRQKVSTGYQASLLTRISILGKLTHDNLTADWTVFLIRLLVFLLEAGPIFLKLLSGRSGYDAWRDAGQNVDIASAVKWERTEIQRPEISAQLYPTPTP
jgi:Domain of unknown function (DUF4407)